MRGRTTDTRVYKKSGPRKIGEEIGKGEVAAGAGSGKEEDLEEVGPEAGGNCELGGRRHVEEIVAEISEREN